MTDTVGATETSNERQTKNRKVRATQQGDRSNGSRGLHLERLYTTAGVHPYDEVTWQRRDVVMTNWRDGSINFEQRGVEFPDFWSINATNIVTSKYFRGAVGTPTRESSLRQIIDRVVGTYTAAGVEHGYFATAEDEADLRARTHLDAAAPAVRLQLARLVQRGNRFAAAGGEDRLVSGAPPGTRTPNPRIKSPLLCQLS